MITEFFLMTLECNLVRSLNVSVGSKCKLQFEKLIFFTNDIHKLNSNLCGNFLPTANSLNQVLNVLMMGDMLKCLLSVLLSMFFSIWWMLLIVTLLQKNYLDSHLIMCTFWWKNHVMISKWKLITSLYSVQTLFSKILRIIFSMFNIIQQTIR